MAVPESTPPVSPPPNNTKLLGQTLIKSNAIQHAVLGRFQSPSVTDILLASESHITLGCPSSSDEELRVLHQQPVHGTVLDLKVLPASRRQAGPYQVDGNLDHAVLLTDANTVSLLTFDSKLHRFIKVCQHHFGLLGSPCLRRPHSLAVAPCGAAVAVIAYDWMTLLLLDKSSDGMCFQVAQQCTMAPGSAGTNMARETISFDALPDRGSTPGYQYINLGIIRKACFLEIDREDGDASLCLAVVHDPDLEENDAMLDIFTFPGGTSEGDRGSAATTPELRFSLRQSTLAAKYGFLDMALDLCMLPTHPAGLVLMFQTGIVVLDFGGRRPSHEDAHSVACDNFAKGAGDSAQGSLTLVKQQAYVAVLYAGHWPTPDPEAHRIEQDEVRKNVLTSWCWHSRASSSASPSQEERSTRTAEQLHHQLLLGFDQSSYSAMPMLSLVVQQSSDTMGCTFTLKVIGNGNAFSSPTAMLTLPNGNVLLGSEAGDSHVLKWGAHGSYTAPVLHNAAPVWDFVVANLQQLPQPQIYAACGQVQDGSIRVMQADQAVDLLYQSPADYPGISGMWSLPPWPGADCHTLLVLSFASGSRAMATGTTLKDVTEAVGLVANERTLACACLADCLAVQVMRNRMHLFSMKPSVTPEHSELSCSPSGDRSRVRLWEPPTLADLEISAPEDRSEDLSPMPARPANAELPTAHTPPEHQSSAAPAAEVYGGGEGTWAPPGGASISTAAAAEGIVVAACTHFKGLVALQAVLVEEGQAQAQAQGFAQRAKGALASWSPGKRKRARKRWCLQELASIGLPDEVSCIHLMPYAPGGPACKLVAAGTYEPSLQLLMLQHDGVHHKLAQMPLFQPIASVDIAPLLQHTLSQSAANSPRAGSSSPGAGWTSPRAVPDSVDSGQVPEQVVPESVQILPSIAAHADIQVIVGLRNGALLQLASPKLRCFPPPPPDASPQLQLVTVRQVGSLPVVLMPLPTAVGLEATSLAVSDRLALLHMAPGSGRAVATALTVAGVSHAVPLWQPGPLCSDSLNSRFTVLCAPSNGSLQLVDLQPHEDPHVRALPLDPKPGRPVRLVVHPASSLLIVACEAAPSSWNVCCVSPLTGQVLAKHSMRPGESISSLHIWHTSSAPSAPPSWQLPPEQQPMAEAAAAETNLQQGVQEACGGILTPTAAAEEGGLIVVGTKDRRSQWNPCKGRLLTLQLVGSAAGVSLETVSESEFADEVHAVSSLPGRWGPLVAAIGYRLVSFGGLARGRLTKRHLIATSQPVTWLSPHLSQGRLVASNSSNSVMVYSYSSETGFRLLHADRYSRPATRSCIVQQPKPSQATAVATDSQGRMLFLAPEPESYSCERNMHTAAQYYMGQNAAGLVPANLLQPAQHAEASTAAAPAQHQEPGSKPGPHPALADLAFSSLNPSSSSALPAEGPAQSPAAQLHQGAAILTSMHDDRSHHLRRQASCSLTGQASHSPASLSPTGGPSPTSSPSALTAALSAHQNSPRHPSRTTQQQLAPDCASWVSVTTAGEVIQVSTVTAEQHVVLTALQEVMAADVVTAPLSGCHVTQYRTGKQQAGLRQHLQESRTALDGDLLSQFLQLPVSDQQRLTNAAVQTHSMHTSSQAVLLQLPLRHIVHILESALSGC